MPSPFPGMDPYLEESWRDVHSSLVLYFRDALQESLPDSLIARVEQRVVLELPTGWASGSIFPDVRVTEFRPGAADGAQKSGAVAARAILCEADSEPITEGFVEVIDPESGNRIVTTVEVLSPTNKTPGEAMDDYRRKQRRLCRSSTNLVEIDLLRSGKHVLAVALTNIPAASRTSYAVCVRRATDRAVAEVYPIPLSQRLPAIKVPLRPQDEDVVVDLQALVDQCYDRGRYARTIDYDRDPLPPFGEEEGKWADALLRSKGVRKRPTKE